MKIFITGTDTGVGKTRVSVALLRKLNSLSLSTIGMKPIASGCIFKNGSWYNDDALALQREASVPLDYSLINPFALQKAVAPHIAGELSGISLSKQPIIERMQALFQYSADVYIIEGAGGWSVPLNETELFSEVVAALEIPVVLVVGLRLGCLNHALLTIAAIRQAKAYLIGWVGNSIDLEMECPRENVRTLQRWISAPCLGILPYHEAPENPIDTDLLLKNLSLRMD